MNHPLSNLDYLTGVYESMHLVPVSFVEIDHINFKEIVKLRVCCCKYIIKEYNIWIKTHGEIIELLLWN